MRLMAPTWRRGQVVYEWASELQEQVDGEADGDDAENHAHIGQKMIGVRGEAHDDTDGAGSGEHRHGHGRKRDVFLGEGFFAFLVGRAAGSRHHAPRCVLATIRPPAILSTGREIPKKLRTNRPKNMNTTRIAIT